jgi:hypothetical protein
MTPTQLYASAVVTILQGNKSFCYVAAEIGVCVTEMLVALNIITCYENGVSPEIAAQLIAEVAVESYDKAFESRLMNMDVQGYH